MNTQQHVQKVTEIINAIRGKNAVEKRVEALESAGYTVHGSSTYWNFGKSGTVNIMHGVILAQLSCAVARKTKNGYNLNACTVFAITPNKPKP